MSDFENYVCWQEEAVLAATPRDAASLLDGHFQAVHHPLRLRRRRIDERIGGRWVAEKDIVAALCGSLRPDGYLFIPIVGGSGTGKSHLVRWVKDQTQSRAHWEARYLPKNRTGIRQAIEIIIRGLSGPKITEAREALEAAPAHTESDEILAERLLDELALLISHVEDLPSQSPLTDDRQRQLRNKLERQLPDVLRDPVVRRKLVAPGAVIQRMVGLALRGRQPGDGLDDDATHFLPTDLPLTFEEIGDASRGARTLLGQLATIPELLAAAVSLINEALPAAEKRVSVSGHVDLVEVFRDVRRALLAEDKELVLYIEDFTVLHGVEREFLDAIVEPARSPDGQMCNLRVIFAVTEGHFDDLDTVRTRCDDAYWLDAPYGEGGVDSQEAFAFLARYLNATRLSPEDVETAWTERRSENWLDNACDECPHQPICHETFGASSEGHGLYPFNKDAASRFVEALSPDRFDPREVVRELVNRFLLLGAVDMHDSGFPSDSLLAPFDGRTEPLAPLVAARVRQLRPSDHERVVNVLRYWGDSSDPTSLPEATLTAFALEEAILDLPALREVAGSGTTAGSTATSRRKRQAETTEGGLGSDLRAPWRSIFAQLAEWGGRNRDLSATATNELRKLIHKSVVANLELGPTPINLGDEFAATKFKYELDIAIVGTVTQQSVDSAVIRIDRSETEAAVLQALILASEGALDASAQSVSYRRLLAESTERWTQAVIAKLAAPPDDAAISAVQALVVAGAVVGRVPPISSPQDLLRAMFDRSPVPALDPTSRSPKWVALHSQAVSMLARARTVVETEFGESRGTRGGVRAVKADSLLPIVEDFTSNWTPSTSDPGLASFMRAVVSATDEEWAALRTRVSEIESIVDRSRAWTEQTEKILSLLRTAHSSGRLRDASVLDTLSGLAAVHPDRVLRSFNSAADNVGGNAELSNRISLLAGDIPTDVAVVHGFMTRAAKAVDGVQQDLEARQAAGGGATDTEEVVAQVLAAVSKLADAVKGLPE